MCWKMAGKHIVTLLAILALSKSFSAAKSTNTKLSVGAKISASNDQKDDVGLGGSDDSLPTDVDETKRCNCDKMIPDLKPDYRPVEYDQPDELDFVDWPEKLGISDVPSALDTSGSISLSGSIGSSGGMKHKAKPIPQDSSDSSSSIDPSASSSVDFDEEPIKEPKLNLDFPGLKIPEISSESLDSKPTQPVSAGKEIEKPRPVRKQVEKKQSKTTVTYTKIKKVTSTPSTTTTGAQGLTCPHV